MSSRRGAPSREFPSDHKYDFLFRPATYWPDLPGEKSVLRGIRGTARRDVAEGALTGEELERLGGDELYREAMEFVLSEELTDDDRASWGGIHPMMMGGEYLPGLMNGEVEIARVELASVTGDVTEVRARREGGRIHYRVVDEYWDEGSRYFIAPDSTDEPLALGELIELIDTTQRDEGHRTGDDSYDIGLVDSSRNANYDETGDHEGLAFFARVRSTFYPVLSAYYDDRAQHWLDERRREFEEYDAEA